MDAILALQVAIGVIAHNLKGTRLDAGIIRLEEVADHAFVAILLSPAHIHAHQHLRPILCLCAACS